MLDPYLRICHIWDVGPKLRQCRYCYKVVDNLKLCDHKYHNRTCDLPMCEHCSYSPKPNTDYCKDHRVTAGGQDGDRDSQYSSVHD